jgi:D-Tyr-tRNAtyr deacylase
MIALIQRVLSARVDVDNETVGAIGPGLLALVAVQPDDGETQTKRMLERRSRATSRTLKSTIICRAKSSIRNRSKTSST